ncbi:fatty acid desaturase [Haloferula sp. BvORR071]|uniref:fatty acid desaturase family protein n=1 Tax=Haloferula sp. BvORR071 TaxID=1396141 RepID=UPI000695FFEC|nr:fatty acid desaturase [Haloferula sp. BvORR071]
MKKPSLESLGLDLLETTPGERWRCLLLPFATCAGFFAAAREGWWWLALICAALQSFFTYASVSHDLVHRTLKLPAWLNESLLSLIEGLSFRSGHAFRASHLNHHQKFPHDDDLEGAAAKMSWWRALLDGVTAQARMWCWALRRAKGAGRWWLLGEAAGIALWAGWCCTSPVGIAYLAITVAGSWVYPFMTSFMPHIAGGEDPLHQTRLFRGKVVAWLSLEHLYHLEHHLYPQVPHQRWPELARRLDPFFAEQRIQPVILWR